MIVVLKKDKKDKKQTIVCYLKDDVVLSDRMKSAFEFVEISDTQYEEIQTALKACKAEDRLPELEVTTIFDAGKIKVKQRKEKDKEFSTKEKVLK